MSGQNKENIAAIQQLLHSELDSQSSFRISLIKGNDHEIGGINLFELCIHQPAYFILGHFTGRCQYRIKDDIGMRLAGNDA